MGIFEEAIIMGDEVLEFIPQRAPIVMVDEFFGVDSEVSISGLTVKRENIFCEEGVLQECGIIEHIAQSAALRVGYIYKSQGKEIPIGYIGSVSKLKIFHLPKEEETLKTEIRVEQEVFNITLINAKTKVGDLNIAECQMKIFLQE